MTYYDDRILSGSYYVEFAVELQLSGSTLRGWSGHDDIVIENNTFSGIGTHGTIGTSAITDDLSSHHRQYILNGVSSDFLIEFQKNGGGKNRPVIEYILYFDRDTKELIQIEKTFVGRIDEIPITLEGKGAAISMNAADASIDFGKARCKRYTNAQQQLDHPDDRIFEFVNAIQSTTINWHGQAMAPSIKNNVAGLYKA